jgi:hypothetical protein
MEKNNKGNPVPSLEIQDFTVLREGLYALKDNITSEYRNKLIEKLRNVLQNGVETDNGQPIENPITFNDFINNNHCKTHWYVLMCNKCKKDFNRLMRQSEL